MVLVVVLRFRLKSVRPRDVVGIPDGGGLWRGSEVVPLLLMVTAAAAVARINPYGPRNTLIIAMMRRKRW